MGAAFDALITDPASIRDYLVTAQPYAIVRASMAQQAAGNRLLAAAGTFTVLRVGDALTLTRPALADVPVTIADLAQDGSWVAVTGVTLADVAAAALELTGLVTRYWSVHGYNSSPTDSPANVHYEGRVQNALRFTRSMYGGARIGGRSIPGFGDITLNNGDGACDGFGEWGWDGRRITVELGGEDFARADFGIIFVGITDGCTLDDGTFSIAVKDLTKLLDQDLYSPRYRGTGGFEGGVDLRDQAKPICIGKCLNVELVPLGIVNGRFTFQFHGGGAVHTYDSGWHVVRDRGVPLTYVAANPAAGQWTLDAANGAVIVGGDEPKLLTADVIGSVDAPAEPSAARAMEYLATRRLVLDSAISLSSLTIGTGSRTLALRDTMPMGVGGYALIAATTAPDSNWMFGQVTGWAAGVLTVTVTATAGVGTFADWTVTKVGLLPGEIATAVGGDVFDALHAINPAVVQVYLRDGGNALDVLDEIANSIGAWYGFNRAGLFDAGRLEAPAGAAVLAIDGDNLLDGFAREEARAPVWRMSVGFARNWRVMGVDDLADSVRRNAVANGTFDSDTVWTKGTGWSIAGGMASAAAGSASDLTQSITLDVGQDYILAADVTRTAGTLTFKVGALTLGAVSASGAVEYAFTATAATPTLTVSKDAAFAGSLDNIAITTAQLRSFQAAYRYPVASADGRVRSLYGQRAVADRLDTLLLYEADALAEQQRQMDLHGVPRAVFTAPAKTEPFAVEIGQAVSLTDGRFGLSGGRLMRVLGIDEDAGDNRVTLTLWG
ncbi:hypothetical protein IP70_15630 [alpha proteobacterium AAP38]|nr:hypothetical protein IP70_15630 [alpha proteobacterium AAP38]